MSFHALGCASAKKSGMQLRRREFFFAKSNFFLSGATYLSDFQGSKGADSDNQPADVQKERPGIVHRLDKETSGCLVVAKNDAAHRELSRQFAERIVEKVYLALVAGKLRKAAGVIEEKIGRHPVHRQRMSVASSRGRPAKTEYHVIRSGARASLIECRLHSGRTHQIRVHLHHLGYPVLGDKVYGARPATNFSRQMLHAWEAWIPPSGQRRTEEF